MSSWIKMLSDEMADTELKQALDEARTLMEQLIMF